MELPIPTENEDPFFTVMGQFFTKLDTWVQSIREDLGLYVTSNGGNWAVGPGDVVSWDASITLTSATDGGNVRAGADSIACADGHLIYMVVPSRPISGLLVGTIETAATLPTLSALVVPIAYRNGLEVVLLARGTMPSPGRLPRTWRGFGATATDATDPAGTGGSGAWTPRTLAALDHLDLPISFVEHGILSASAASSYFRVDGDQTRFYPVGKRFSCLLSSTANDTTDKEFVTAGAVYDAGNDWTTITINTTPAAYIKDAVADIGAPAGKLYPGWFGLSTAGRLLPDYVVAWVTLTVQGFECDRFQARIIKDDLAAPSLSFDAAGGSMAGGGAWEDVTTAMGEAVSGAGAQNASGTGQIVFTPGTDEWFLVMQYVETAGAGPAYPAWGRPAPALSGMEDTRLMVSMIEISE
jgi:hypothetical protein